jgi:hypothetical protein
VDDYERCLVYPYMSGRSLESRLSGKHGNATLTPLQRAAIACGVARGLAALHAARKVHRDVKTSNILLDDACAPVLADMGIAKGIAVDATYASTRSIKGTTGYLDPAYHRTGDVGPWSDVYSFGVVLLELITSQRPIARPDATPGFDTPVDLVARCLPLLKAGQSVSVADTSLQWPTRLRNTLGRLAAACLADDAAARPTARALAEELEQYAPAPPPPPPAPQSPPRASPPVRSTSQRQALSRSDSSRRALSSIGGLSDGATDDDGLCVACLSAPRLRCGHAIVCAACAGVSLPPAPGRCPDCGSPQTFGGALTSSSAAPLTEEGFVPAAEAFPSRRRRASAAPATRYCGGRQAPPQLSSAEQAAASAERQRRRERRRVNAVLDLDALDSSDSDGSSCYSDDDFGRPRRDCVVPNGAGVPQEALHAFSEMFSASATVISGVVQALQPRPTQQLSKASSDAALPVAADQDDLSYDPGVASSMEPLFALLSSSRSPAAQVAAGVLGVLALEPRSRAAIIGAGGVPQLVGLLKQGAPGGREAAASALANLSSGRGGFAREIARAGALGPLARALVDGGEAEGDAAARAVRNLAAADGDIAVALCRAGAMAALVRMLGVRSSRRSRESAASALGNLASAAGSRGARDAAAAAGAVPTLVQLLTSALSRERAAAAAALQSLTASHAANRDAVLSAGAIPPLVDMLSKSPEERVAAASALCNLAVGASPTAANAIRDRGGVPALMRALQGGVPREQGLAAGCLCNMAVNKEAHAAALIAAGAAQPLLDLVRAGGAPARTALRTVRVLLAAAPVLAGPAFATAGAARVLTGALGTALVPPRASLTAEAASAALGELLLAAPSAGEDAMCADVAALLTDAATAGMAGREGGDPDGDTRLRSAAQEALRALARTGPEAAAVVEAVLQESRRASPAGCCVS